MMIRFSKTTIGTLLLLLTSVGASWCESVYVVPIEGMIDGGLAAFVERVVEEADEQSVDAIVFEVNTFGGRVDAAVTIRDAILNSEARTVAFINKRAISAGALISLACQKIVMTKGASIGAATAVDMEGQKASEKVISYFRAEMRATAEKTGRSPEIAEAMVDEEVEIPDLSPKGELLTMTTEEALNYQIADETAETLSQVLNFYDLSHEEILRLKPNWAEQVVRFLTHPIVSSLLMTLGFLGLIFEVRTPGWGVGGTVGVLSLGLFFGSHFIVQLAGWEELLLFILGAGLLLTEVLFIPGFGVVGILGIVMMFASLFLSLVGRVDLLTAEEVWGAVTRVGASMLLTMVLSVLILRSLPKINAWNRLILQTEERRTEGFSSAPQENQEFMGTSGVALTMLRPVGTGLFNGRRLSVVSEGVYIEKDSAIQIVEVEGSRIVVREI